MKSFFIIKKDLSHTVDEKFLVQEESEIKNDLLKQMNLNGLNINDFNFYNELNTDNKFISMYHEAIFETYFPRVKENNILVYYPEPKIIETPDSKIYVNKWDPIDVSQMDISSILYISDDSDPEEHQRVLFIFKS